MSSSHFFFWSSHRSACFGSNAESWIPFCCFFFVHLVSGCGAILTANLHFIFFEFRSSKGHCLPSSSLRLFSRFFFVFNPVLSFNFSCVDVFTGVIHEGDFTVLVAFCV